MKKICVLGSINTDLVSKIAQFPKAGETIKGESFQTFCGGKGANQGIAAGRLGADVRFLGKIGNDSFGGSAIENFESVNVDAQYIVSENINSGIAVIAVSESGENSIIYIPGANNHVDVAYVKANKKAIEEADILLLQLETPLETATWAAEYAASKDKIVILDPAPAVPLPEKLLKNCDIITPNETELEILTENKITSNQEIIEAAQTLFERGVKMLVYKCGSNGAYLITPETMTHVDGFKVKALDTTAAGDSFNAGLAVSLANGETVLNSIRYGNAVAAISVTKMGAQSAMPTAEEVAAFLNKY